MPDMFLNTGLKFDLVNQLRAIFSEYSSIKQVQLYGSRAKGTYRPSSDIDLTFVGNISHQELMSIEILIDDLLTPYSYDLSILSEIKNQSMLEHINRVGLVIYPDKVES